MIKSIFSLLSHDIHIERMSLARGPFRFSREVHTGSDWEFWGLGLYVAVSRLRMSPQV